MTTDAFQDARGEGAARLAADLAEAERQERQRLAEALHDDALQRLLVARQDLAEADDDPDALRAVGRQLDELTEALRALTRAMHDETLSALPLATALERLAEDGARRGRLRVFTQVDPAATGDHDPFVLGVARELLMNVVKHAHASVVEITVAAEDEALVVRVADDGRGMTREEVEHAGRTGHLGHARLRRRLAALGGTLEVEAAPMAGTTVSCTIPLENLQAQRTLHEALRRERRWSAALVAAMQDGFVVFRDGVAVQANDRFCAMTGFGHAELEGFAGDATFWPPERLADFEALDRDARSAGGAEARGAIVRRDGSRFPALVAARAIHDDRGGHAGLLVTVKDITSLEAAAERRRLELELGAVVAATNRLRSLLEAARAVTDEPGLDLLLAEIARTISEDLGWSVVINLYRPAWDDFVVATGHGLAPEGWAVLEGATYQWAEWTPLLDDSYARRGAYLVPAGEPPGGIPGLVSWSPPMTPGEGPDAWQADDDLLIPFRHTEGHFLGVLSLDAPASGQRPTDAELDVLVALADHAALAVQHAQTAIESARHAAALDRLLHVSSHIAGTREIAPMLEDVAQAITDALGFERVVVEVAGADGRLRPLATHDRSAGPGDLDTLDPIEPGELSALLDPGFGVEGCFLLTRDEAAERLPEERRALLASHLNGRGWRAWDDHVVLVPLHGTRDQVVGAIWVDDPADRLLPGAGRLQALHAFANQATAAMIAAERYARLEGLSEGDTLTELGNRRAFLRELDREVARATRTAGCSVLLLAQVEDPGAAHPAGPGGVDEGRLRAVGEALASELRRHDRAFRLDGALFALLLPGGRQPPETGPVARRLAGRLRTVGAEHGLRVHFGAANLGPSPERPDVALERAFADLLERRREGLGPSPAAR